MYGKTASSSQAMAPLVDPKTALAAPLGKLRVRSDYLAAAQAKLGAKAQTLLYNGLSHSDIIMAVAQPFRSKAPVIDDLAAFFDGVR